MKAILFTLMLMGLVGCSTTAKFNVPADTDLYVYNQKVNKAEYENYKRRPYGWGQAAGIRYRLEKDGKVLEEGTLKSRFRPVSIFWPPAALIYWPMGFVGHNHTYDFTKKDDFVRPSVVHTKK
ncbi:MAG: hypothetical protein VX642_02100 [Bdellovibrionota bacterium]|nr:hypothetical protein [Bdellovibrionota bacterium]